MVVPLLSKFQNVNFTCAESQSQSHGAKRKNTAHEDQYLVRQAKLSRQPDEDCPRVTDLTERSSVDALCCATSFMRGEPPASLKTRTLFVNNRNKAIYILIKARSRTHPLGPMEADLVGQTKLRMFFGT